MNRVLGTLLVSLVPLPTATAEPATPDFGPNVLILDASMTNIQSRLDAVFSQQERSQFGTNRYVTIRLSGRPNSGINHVINGTGDAVITTRKAIVN